jgi:hypothetical protein
MLWRGFAGAPVPISQEESQREASSLTESKEEESAEGDLAVERVKWIWVFDHRRENRRGEMTVRGELRVTVSGEKKGNGGRGRKRQGKTEKTERKWREKVGSESEWDFLWQNSCDHLRIKTNCSNQFDKLITLELNLIIKFYLTKHIIFLN